ncbi:hypothetical protein JCM17846_14640 [Iodidimonas nitroreducens]|uniref:Uncharacterized protein n=1 Tax=Iodidimonas nitroreducens TaxID=1236968 RepID=A0A5A7N634_9PROT|nr:ATP-grasp domain-containing protein [Iodidimonas nitroreducens]GAK34116.1 hypothetical protein AQ1_02012 [alpha proteobacterium Q-1]GER03782.1 hypothetical protein JCM17846_14640 [Iodidimonas nitroreducens]
MTAPLMTAPEKSDTERPIAAPHANMPALDESAQKLSFFEFWPQWLFYTPVILWWLWLSLRYGGPALPTAANPGFPNGGFVGESKAQVFSRFGVKAKAALAPFICFCADHQAKDQSLSVMAEARGSGLDYPLVAKPDMGCRGAGVQVVRNDRDLDRYIASFPDGARIVLQKLVDQPGEVGLFYVRSPSQKQGRLFSMTLKYFPTIIGNGRDHLERLIMDDPRAGQLPHLYLKRNATRLDEIIPKGEPVRLAFAGSHSKGAIFRDGRPYITEALTQAIDALARDIDGFYIGRFDVRFSDFKALQEGRDFTIIEVNGAGGEATHIWDSRMTLKKAYGDLFEQFSMLFAIGRDNRRRGAPPINLLEFYRAWRHEARLVRGYPPTD